MKVKKNATMTRRSAFLKILSMTMILSFFMMGIRGGMDWPMGWIYIGIVFLNSWIVFFLMPADLVKERTVLKKDMKKWDKPLAAVMAWIGPMMVLALSALDRRFEWSSPIRFTTSAAALVFMLLGMIISDWALLTNRFFSAVVRIQKERGHQVVENGPYRFVRHPGYLGGIITNLCLPLVLGSWWAYLPTGFILAIILLRTGLEDRTLAMELDGYAAYAERVRFRLFPGIF